MILERCFELDLAANSRPNRSKNQTLTNFCAHHAREGFSRTVVGTSSDPQVPKEDPKVGREPVLSHRPWLERGAAPMRLSPDFPYPACGPEPLGANAVAEAVASRRANMTQIPNHFLQWRQ